MFAGLFTQLDDPLQVADNADCILSKNRLVLKAERWEELLDACVVFPRGVFLEGCTPLNQGLRLFLTMEWLEFADMETIVDSTPLCLNFRIVADQVAKFCHFFCLRQLELLEPLHVGFHFFCRRYHSSHPI